MVAISALAAVAEAEAQRLVVTGLAAKAEPVARVSLPCSPVESCNSRAAVAAGLDTALRVLAAAVWVPAME